MDTLEKRQLRSAFLAALFALMLGTAGWPAAAQSTGQRYFPETGHWLSGDFLSFYESVSNPEFLYGYPITDAFLDPRSGLMSQYFQRAHLTLNPANSPGERVVRTPLGREIYEPGGAIEIAANNPACQRFGGSEAMVCYSFLDFYLEHGGPGQFGNPISGMEFHQNRIMQYFEYARIEWHPDAGRGAQITLGNLGEVFFNLRGEDNRLKESSRGNRIQQAVIDLRASVFPETAIVGANDSQTLFVTVRDQNLEPISQAQVTYVVRFPSGATISNLMMPTDANGVTQQDFPVNSSDLGMVEVVVTISHANLIKVLRTSFRIWF
jgi:hypothetical protein